MKDLLELIKEDDRKNKYQKYINLEKQENIISL